jgi:peptidylprolyl isomerase
MRFAVFVMFGFLFAYSAHAAAYKLPPGLDAENTLVLKLKNGDVLIKLRPDLAPKHVERIKLLTRKGFYNGIVFHRVIEGFMAQTGDPTGTGEGGSDLPDLKAEFTAAPFIRGTVGMARMPTGFDTANSQWFICFTPKPGLNGQYTVFGEVVKGMEAADKIKRGQGEMGLVPAPADKILSLQVAADVK